MLVLDTKDSPSTNVFKIRQGKETPADKKSLLTQFRHVAEELAAKERKEREGEHERRKSMWNGGGGGGDFSNANKMLAAPDWMALARRVDPDGSANTDAKEKADRDARWAGDTPSTGEAPGAHCAAHHRAASVALAAQQPQEHRYVTHLAPPPPQYRPRESAWEPVEPPAAGGYPAAREDFTFMAWS
ncbi:hypothetical protein K438DRAFT_1954516 [Mycena galopus ATCC 62051]|nr:hypothetical protein K438DRAFT_1954516 [Mycena galopus ATCC 62051]